MQTVKTAEKSCIMGDVCYQWSRLFLMTVTDVQSTRDRDG
jgi:hypothetical protein